MVICAITGLVIVTSIIANPSISQEDGGMLTNKAFDMIPYIGTPILTFGIPLKCPAVHDYKVTHRHPQQ